MPTLQLFKSSWQRLQKVYEIWTVRNQFNKFERKQINTWFVFLNNLENVYRKLGAGKTSGNIEFH